MSQDRWAAGGYITLFKPGVPPDLQSIVNKALEKNRNLRHQTASDLRTDLQCLKRGSHSPSLIVTGNKPAKTLPETVTLPAHQTALPEVKAPTQQKKRGLAFGVGALAFIVIASLAVWWRFATGTAAAAHLRIQANPGAQVLIDEKVSGTVGPDGAAAIDVPPGEHQVQLGLKGYKLYSTTIAAKGGEWKSLVAQMDHEPPLLTPRPQMGNLFVQSNVPGADVFVNGQLKETTWRDNTVKMELDEGTYKIQLKKPGYKDSLEQPVEILAQKESQVAFTLVSSEGPELAPSETYLIIKSNPGAEIRIGGKVSGMVANDGTFPAKVAPGQHLVQVRLSGYQPYSSSVPVEANGKRYLVADLKPSAPVVTLFGASHARITLGQTANLKWTTQNATEVRIDPEIGAVPPNGAQDVSPAKATTYVLTAKGSGGRATAETSVAVGPNPDVQAITETLARFKGAYDSMDINALRREWPSLTQTQSDAIKTTFVGVASLRLNDDCDGLPMISGDTAEWTCTETLSYVLKGAHQIPDEHNTIVYSFKRNGGKWHVDRRQGAHYGKSASN